MDTSKIFVLTGPESSGKSTLAVQLCDCLQAPLVMEAARDYLNEKLSENPKFSYQQNDLLAIAKLQHAQESALLPFHPEKIICDTDLLVIIVWSEVKYGTCDPWIIKTFKQTLSTNNPRHYFLCDWKIPWQQDSLRENPDNREELFSLYLEKMLEYKLDYTLISGDHHQRLQSSLDKSL